MSAPLPIGNHPTDASYARDNYFVVLMERVELETSDTNLVTICDAGLYTFATKDSAKSFTQACNSVTTEPIARAFAKTENKGD